MSTGIRWQFAHHRRTKRRLNISAFCYPIRSGRLCLACDFRRLGRGASRSHAMGFLCRPFGTRGSQVQILSPDQVSRRNCKANCRSESSCCAALAILDHGWTTT